MNVYMDNAASTKVSEKVLERMKEYFFKEYSNPASPHTPARKAENALEKSREFIADSINAEKDEVIFTSGGTEANNTALKGAAFSDDNSGSHIITTEIEHDSVLNSCRWLEEQGFEVTYLETDENGFVDPEDLQEAIRDETLMASIIHGNNEIGTIQDLEELGEVCRENDIYFHADSCQSYTKTELDVQKQDIDLCTLNAHKIHGPKGVGVLYIDEEVNINPWQHGGGHERGLRSGTPNVHGAVGFMKAARLALEEKEKYVEHMKDLRDRLIEDLVEVEKVELNGPRDDRLCNNVNLLIRGMDGESMVDYLNREGIYCTTGAACSTHKLEPSSVLRAIGRSREEAGQSIRLTLSRYTTEEEIERVINTVKKGIETLRKT